MTLLPATVGSISGLVLVFILTGPVSNECLQSWQRVGAKRRMPASLDRKPQGAIEAGELINPQSLGLPLAQPHPSDRLSVLDLVIEGNGITPDVKTTWQRLQTPAGCGVQQLVRLQNEVGILEVPPAPYRLQLLSDPVAEPSRGDLRHRAPRSPP
jgi:hypothetical protein